jgi:hypothetical protein
VCAYHPLDVTCANGCDEGNCLGDPCADTVCSQAPTAFCVDQKTERVFDPVGICSKGELLVPTQRPGLLCQPDLLGRQLQTRLDDVHAEHVPHWVLPARCLCRAD